jgi:dihydrofolate reductase
MGVSLDGFTADRDGQLDWAAPDEELMRFHIEQTSEIGAHASGRRLYEDMLVWETAEPTRWGRSELEFARVWKAIPKVVFSTTLTSVQGNARLAGGDVADEIAKLRAEPGDRVVSVGGAGFAATVAGLDIIDEYRLFVSPVLLGGGTPFFAPLQQRMALDLIETRTFGSGVIYSRYRRARGETRSTDAPAVLTYAPAPQPLASS